MHFASFSAQSCISCCGLSAGFEMLGVSTVDLVGCQCRIRCNWRQCSAGLSSFSQRTTLFFTVVTSSRWFLFRRYLYFHFFNQFFCIVFGRVVNRLLEPAGDENQKVSAAAVLLPPRVSDVLRPALNITDKITWSVSSGAGMIARLTDSNTETFW
jgi:hypothetical protein